MPWREPIPAIQCCRSRTESARATFPSRWRRISVTTRSICNQNTVACASCLYYCTDLVASIRLRVIVVGALALVIGILFRRFHKRLNKQHDCPNDQQTIGDVEIWPRIKKGYSFQPKQNPVANIVMDFRRVSTQVSEAQPVVQIPKNSACDQTKGDREPAIPCLFEIEQPDDNYENCLLYTSPSPRDATLSRMPSSA